MSTLLLLLLLMVTTAANADMTGNEFRVASKDVQLAWVDGYLKGMREALLVYGNKSPPALALWDCLDRLSSAEITAISVYQLSANGLTDAPIGDSISLVITGKCKQ